MPLCQRKNKPHRSRTMQLCPSLPISFYQFGEYVDTLPPTLAGKKKEAVLRGLISQSKGDKAKIAAGIQKLWDGE